jgi:fimbrial chaperone protein
VFSLKPRLAGGGGRLRAPTLAFVLPGLLASAPADAGSFSVSPVIVSLEPAQRSTALSIENAGSASTAVRVRLYRWTQTDGEDRYTPTDELIASPPIFTLPAHGKQLLRVGPRSGVPSGAYRIMIEEIAGPDPKPDGIAILLRLNVPLYAYDARGAADLRWTGWIDDAGNLSLEATNAGDYYDQVVEIAKAGDEGDKTLTSRMGVVLPGGSQRWNVGEHTDIAPGAPLQIAVRSNTGAVDHYQVAIGRR